MVISAESSSTSGLFSFGTNTVLIPAFLAASNFSFRPPMGRILPRRVISPVIATSARAFWPVMADIMAVAMVTPAEGPSFGTAPSGIWMWISWFLKKSSSMPCSRLTERI